MKIFRGCRAVVRFEDGQLRTHTGQLFAPDGGAWLDEDGNLLVAGAGSVALLDDRDLDAVSEHFVRGDGSALDEDDAEAAIDAPDDLWSQIDPARETLIVLWDGWETHQTEEIWLVAVFQLISLVDIQWRIPRQGPPGVGQPYMVLAVASGGITDVSATLDHHPLD